MRIGNYEWDNPEVDTHQATRSLGAKTIGLDS
jgi:hypothetical protein